MWECDKPEEWTEADILRENDLKEGKPEKTFDEYVEIATKNRENAISAAEEFAKSRNYKFVFDKSDFPENIDIREYARNVMFKVYNKDENPALPLGFCHSIGNKKSYVSYTDWTKVDSDSMPKNLMKKLLNSGILKKDRHSDYVIIPITAIVKIDDIFRHKVDETNLDFMELFLEMLNYLSIANGKNDEIPELGTLFDMTGDFIFDTSQLAFWLVECYLSFLDNYKNIEKE